MPLSTVFFSSSRPLGRASAILGLCSLVSVILVRSFPSARWGAAAPLTGRIQHARPKTGQPLHVLQQPLRQATWRNGDMHQLSRPRPAPSSALEKAAISGRSGASRRSFAPTVGRTVARRHQHRRLRRAQPRAHLLEAHHDLAGTPRQAHAVQRTLREQPLDLFAEIRLCRRRRPRRPCEELPGDGLVYHIPIRTQPHTTPRQTLVEIGHDPIVGIEHEAEQMIARAARPGHQAAALRGWPPDAASAPGRGSP